MQITLEQLYANDFIVNLVFYHNLKVNIELLEAVILKAQHLSAQVSEISTQIKAFIATQDRGYS